MLRQGGRRQHHAGRRHGDRDGAQPERAAQETWRCAACRKDSSVYFIGEVGISGTEILVFNIDVAPATGGGRHSVQFKREFFAD